VTVCFRCNEDKEQLLAIDNPRIGFKDTVCFECVVTTLKDYKKMQGIELVNRLFNSESETNEVQSK
tara:strand:- start:1412 stop:1609 length:198 start_codon:yes stop_codon:yes gene_type:complete